MIIGAVENFEASIELEIFDDAGHPQRVIGVIDTGYNGHLTLPAAIIASLGLSLAGQRRAKLADGTLVLMDTFCGSVNWHGARRSIFISQSDGGALVGMRLLAGCQLSIEAVEGGRVVIETLAKPEAES